MLRESSSCQSFLLNKENKAGLIFYPIAIPRFPGVNITPAHGGRSSSPSDGVSITVIALEPPLQGSKAPGCQSALGEVGVVNSIWLESSRALHGLRETESAASCYHL